MEVDPKVVVSADVRDMAAVPEGSLLVLLPKPGDAEWLNLQRPLIAQRSLKVVLFCDNETTVELSERAPDFFDWISQHQEAPPGLPMHAVLGLRAAFEAEEPIVWLGSSRERLMDVVSAAFPGVEVRWIRPTRPYSEVIQEIRFATKKKAWVGCCPQTVSHLRRFRWAVAEAGRSSGVIVMTDSLACPGYWPVHDRLMPLDEAYRALRGAGAARPGFLASITGLEPEAVEITQELLRRGQQEEHLIDLLRTAADPGAALAEEMHRTGNISASAMLDIAMRRAAPPLLRAGARDPDGMRLRSEHLALIERRLAKKEPVENGDLAAFAATRRAPPSVRCAPCEDVEAQIFLVEALLRRKAHLEKVSRPMALISLGAMLTGLAILFGGSNMGLPSSWNAIIPIIGIVIAVLGPIFTAGIKGRVDSNANNIIKKSSNELVNQRRRLIHAYEQGAYADAKNGIEALLDIARCHLDTDDGFYQSTLAFYANVLVDLGDDSKGLQTLDELIGKHAVLQPIVPILIPSMATILMRTGLPIEAEALLRKLLGPEASLRGNGQSPARTISIQSMSAETNEALAVFLAQPGSPELSVGGRVEALRLLAEALLLQGRHDEAEDLLERAVVLTHDLTPDSQEQWRVRLAMGRALLAQGRHRDARNVLEIASTQAKDAVGETHPDHSVILEELARIEQSPGTSTAPPG